MIGCELPSQTKKDAPKRVDPIIDHAVTGVRSTEAKVDANGRSRIGRRCSTAMVSPKRCVHTSAGTHIFSHVLITTSTIQHVTPGAAFKEVLAFQTKQSVVTAASGQIIRSVGSDQVLVG